MNKQQLKILTTKLLPITIMLIFLIGGGFTFIGIKIYGLYIENELENTNWTKEVTNEVSKKITVSKLNFPLGDWKIGKQITFPKEIGEGGMIILTDKKENFVSVTYTTHRYITDLHEYSEHANERTVRNMKPTGIILKSKKIEDIKFKGLDAVQETFESLFKPTGEVSEYISTNIKYKGVFYTLGYFNEPNTTNLISKFYFLN